ncbi:hypothetical protein RHGRI_010943 [Rhododendron griersonianum]|uniref:Uncharacterized protein n=1 Tax=Rhododendron griersonianum TaxID=479676 RepID=A0AAV6KK32_9ERIC|nr:hypothetical protein RHGRI_010943 [Rhododendron griersonianum]
MSEGLGAKAIDSNKMRRKQRNPVDPAPILGLQVHSSTTRSSPSKTLHKPFDLCPGAHSLDSSPSGDYNRGSSLGNFGQIQLHFMMTVDRQEVDSHALLKLCSDGSVMVDRQEVDSHALL